MSTRAKQTPAGSTASIPSPGPRSSNRRSPLAAAGDAGQRRAKSPRTLTTQQLADILDLDRATVLRWCAEGLPFEKPKILKDGKRGNLYNVAEVQGWMKSNNRTGTIGRPAESNEDLKAMKLRKERALVARYERENAVQEGKLIDAAAEQIRDVQKITVIRNRLVGLGAAIAPQLEGLDGAERQSLIEKSIEEILEEFATGEAGPDAPGEVGET